MSDLRERIEEILDSEDCILNMSFGEWAGLVNQGIDIATSKIKRHLATYLAQELDEVIFPKFKVGQEVWVCDWFYQRVGNGKINDVRTNITYYVSGEKEHNEEYVFPTQAEAERALKSEVGK